MTMTCKQLSIFVFLTSMQLALVSELALASQEATKQEADGSLSESQGESDAESDGQSESRSVTTDIPSDLRGKSLILRMGGKDYKLKGTKLLVPLEKNPQSTEIRDSSGRIVTRSSKRTEKSMLKGQYARYHGISHNLGESYSPSGRWKEILFDQTRLQHSIEYEYQPGPIGILAGIVNQTNFERIKSGLSSTYNGTQLRFSLRKVWAPFTNGFSVYRRLHFGLYAGGFSASHKIEYQDLYGNMKFKANNYGLIGGYDLCHPFVRNVWLQFRGDITRQKLNFKEIGFIHTEIQQGYVLGVKYVF